ncbi:MAG TPA: quinolinate synthase NadA [Candidatus Limnocylindrales bacterium]|nr:quinolinate synthase NadA [Candidatus Limnocylindrales bacterium]
MTTGQAPGAQRTAESLLEQFRPLGQETTYDEEGCRRIEELVREITELKREKNAVILAHNYQRPEIFEVADFVGDSLELARKGRDVGESTIVLCGVHFMAETAKILAPHKRVLIPDARAGCSLADSVDADALVERRDELRKAFPDLLVISYVNTTAAVKAVTDICCTSSNAVKIVNAAPTQNVLFVPDRNLAAYVAANTTKNVIAWDGDCYVHHQIRPDVIRKVREARPGIRVVAHPECRADVLAEADAVLSTSGMIQYAKENDAPEFLIVTECGLSDRLLLEVPEKKFYKACQLCRYMKMITLEGTRDSLRDGKDEIHLSEEICRRAKASLDRMLELS